MDSVRYERTRGNGAGGYHIKLGLPFLQISELDIELSCIFIKTVFIRLYTVQYMLDFPTF